MSRSDAPPTPPPAQVLWGRVATAVVVVVLAFALGRCSAGGVPEDDVAALRTQVDELQSANDQLQEQVASQVEATTDPEPTPTGSPTDESTASAAPAAGTPGGTYTVEPGDTLHAIAIEVYGDRAQAERIAQANDLEAGATLQVGQVLQLPLAP